MGLSWIDFQTRPGATCAREFICWSILMTAEILIISCPEFFVSSQWFAFSVLCFICAISPKSDGRRRLSAQGCSRQQASKQAACSRVPPTLMFPGKRCDLSSVPHSWLCTASANVEVQQQRLETDVHCLKHIKSYRHLAWLHSSTALNQFLEKRRCAAEQEAGGDNPILPRRP